MALQNEDKGSEDKIHTASSHPLCGHTETPGQELAFESPSALGQPTGSHMCFSFPMDWTQAWA